MKRNVFRYRTGLLTAAALICCSLPLAGCVRYEEEKPIQITLMHGWGGTLKTHYTMQQIYSDFSKGNPDITLKCIPYSDSSIAVETANDMLAVGKMPDILSTNGLSYYVGNAVKRDMALDLMPYIEGDTELREEIHPSVFELWTTDSGSLYTIPDALEVAGYWYNADYFKEAGITDAQGNPRIPKTWPQFMEMIRRLKQWSDDSKNQISVCSLDPVQVSEYLFLTRLAGENFNGREAAESANSVLETETVKMVMDDIAEICSCSREVENIETARQNFYDGASVLYFNGVWESDSLADSENGKSFCYAAYPDNEGGGLSYVSPSSGYVLAKQTDKRKEEACIRFLKYMLGSEVQTKIAVQTGQAPSNPGIDLEQVEKGNPMFGNAVSAAYSASTQIKTVWSVWSEERMEIVEQYCGMALHSWEEEDGQKMAEELNRTE